ncbi:putative mitochondrial import inner membrane translocase subunit tim21 [Quercus suber]|uniref:Mitochondrial import inner membrane translocase subunit Tim21 n=1 Tax=Quercus suber TaxID=58331 RepID=A0AAW0JY73_QUESU
MGTYKYLSGIMRNKQLDMVRLLAEMKCWNYTQNRSILHALRPLQTHEAPRLGNEANQLLLLLKSGSTGRSTFQANRMTKVWNPVLYRRFSTRDCIPWLPFQLKEKYGANTMIPFSTRSISSKASERPRQNKSEKQKGQSGSETKKDISTVEDVFDAPTYNIPEKPVTFVEGASYTAIIIIGLGIAAAAGYAVFKELIFQPKEYKVFNKALKRIQDDSQTKKDISTVEDVFDAPTYNIPEKPVTFVEGASYTAIIIIGLGIAAAAGYAVFKELIFQPKEYKVFNKALKRIQDDSQINFFIRGPHGTGKVYSEMFKDQVDKQWKYTYLIVEIRSPTPSQLILESYMPAYNVDKK